MADAKQESLDALDKLIRRCRRCRLCQSRTRAVPGEGPPDAAILFVGEAPGEREDREGRPFCGRSGAFLDKLFSETGFRRQDVYITSSVKCRPPGNRNPRKDELDICADWLRRQADIIEPRIVVLLGKTALRQVLGSTETLKSVHGRAREWRGRQALPTCHPAAAMRFPEAQEMLRADLAALRRLADEGAPG